jgi:ABC-type nitrate/sulfonate/bicarbonate transport system permease component
MVSTLVALVFGALVGATVGIMVGSSMERSSQLDRLVAREHSTSDLSD